MAFATLQSCTLSGVDAVPITVEVHTAGGLPSVSLVGLPQSTVRESKDRVRAAIQNTGFEFPAVRVTVNLAPADLPKHGGRFDLPIALGIMLARGYLPSGCLDDYCVIGELSLNGELRPVNGVLPSALSLRESALQLLCPSENLSEAIRCENTKVVGACTLHDVVCGLRQGSGSSTGLDLSANNFVEQSVSSNALRWVSTETKNKNIEHPWPCVETKKLNKQVYSQFSPVDFADVKGHLVARRVLEIAASGSHNVLLTGPPGTGKSMLASCLSGVLPPMTEQEALETASIASVSHGEFDASCYGERPFRAPHHSASATALIGGGHRAVPGEISLAHNGVLFLDEMAEFPRLALDAMREPLETGCVHISRLAHRAVYPSRFQLIGATNPCPCGYFGDESYRCDCTESQLQNYRARLSGPLLDRMDLQVIVGREKTMNLFYLSASESSADIKRRVVACRNIQFARQACANQHIDASSVLKLCDIDGEVVCLIKTASERLNLSHRAVHRSLRVARTIADLAGASSVKSSHVTEALSYRMLSSQRIESIL